MIIAALAGACVTALISVSAWLIFRKKTKTAPQQSNVWPKKHSSDPIHSEEVLKFLDEIRVVIQHHNRYQQHGASHFKHIGSIPTSGLLRTVAEAVKKEFRQNVDITYTHDNIFIIKKNKE